MFSRIRSFVQGLFAPLRWLWSKLAWWAKFALITAGVYYGATWGIIPALDRYLHPRSEAGLRMIDYMADDHEVAKVGQAEPELQLLVGGDDEQFGRELLSFGKADGRRLRYRQAAKLAAKNLLERPRVPVVSAGTYSPQGYIPLVVKSVLTLSGEVYSNDGAHIVADPDGPIRIKRNGQWAPVGRDFRPKGMTLRANNAPYLAAIARLCVARGECTEWQFHGSLKIWDPDVVGSGTIQLGVNDGDGASYYGDGIGTQFVIEFHELVTGPKPATPPPSGVMVANTN
ncbi:MAG: hypothetical protein HYW51_00145 [Candidatus Doudnabacteria bacterium]|nr:hypothetical protein [Candidatus Doudnabacteria bacterium]